MALRRIGQILVDLGYVSDEQLELLVDEQKQRPDQLFGRVAMDMGLINDDQLSQALAEQMSLRAVTLGDLTIEPKVLEQVTEPMAQMYRVIPVEFEHDTRHGGHVRSTESGHLRRVADLFRLQHPRGGGHRTGNRRRLGSLLR